MMHDKFQVGEVYSTSCWFTGGSHEYKCIARTESTVTFRARYYEIDGTFDKEPETFDILQDNGREYIVLYEYKGDEHRMYAE